MKLYDFYKTHKTKLSDNPEFKAIWGIPERFKITQNRITPYYGEDRLAINNRLSTLFHFESLDESVHTEMLSFYFQSMHELFVSDINTDWTNHVKFDADKFRLSVKHSITTLKQINNPLIQSKFDERVIFNKGFMVDDDATYFIYTIMATHGYIGQDVEHMKFSYYLKNGIFHFIEPKTTSEKSSTLTFKIEEFKEYSSFLLAAIRHKIFVMFYKNRCNYLFNNQINHTNFKRVHLDIINKIEEKHLIPLKQFMNEQMKVNRMDIPSIDDIELVRIYNSYLTTFEMTQI